MEFETRAHPCPHLQRHLPLPQKAYSIQTYLLTLLAELRKKMLIDDMSCIIKSQVSNEFILHFASIDLRVTTETHERRDDFLNLVKLRFAHLQPSKTLKVYGVVSP